MKGNSTQQGQLAVEHSSAAHLQFWAAERDAVRKQAGAAQTPVAVEGSHAAVHIGLCIAEWNSGAHPHELAGLLRTGIEEAVWVHYTAVDGEGRLQSFLNGLFPPLGQAWVGQHLLQPVFLVQQSLGVRCRGHGSLVE